MAIKEVLELIGSDVVIKQLDAVQKKGEETLATFNKPLPELKFPEIKPPDPKPVQDFTEHTIKLKDALHILRPILQTAGVQIGEFGAFARLASGSVIGLAAALAGAIVVGLAKLEENAARTKGQLTDLFQSSAKGDQAFAALDKQARQFGSTFDGLAPGLEAFQTALNNVNRTAKGFVALKAEDLPGAQIAKNAEAVTEAYGNFIKLLRAGRQTQDDAQKSAKAFFDTLKDGGPVTSAALRALPVGTVNELKIALGAAGLTTQAFFQAVDAGQITIDKFEQALLAFGPQAQKAFDTKAIKTFSDEFGKLLETISRGFESITGKAFSEFVIGEIKAVSKGVQDAIDEFLVVKQAVDFLARNLKIPFPIKPVGPTLEQAGLAGTAFLPTPEMAGKAGTDAGAAFNEGFLKQGFVFPPSAAAKAGDDAAALYGKGFKTNPFFTEPLKLPEPDKTDAEKNFDTLLKDLSDKTKELTPPDLFTLPKLDIAPIMGDATTAAKNIFDSFIEGIKKKWEELNQLKRPDFPLASPSGTPGGIPPLAATPGLSLLSSLFGATQQVTPQNLTLPFQQASDQITQIWTALMGFISGSVASLDLSSATTSLVTPFQTAATQIQQILQNIGQAVDQLLQKLQNAQSSAAQLSSFQGFGGQAGGAPFAAGGMVRGPGSTTSDSILAWLSNREFVVNAKAVSHYGPDFFAALNAMRLPFNFNVGGMARMLSGNKLAGGGMVKGNPVILNIDRKSFNMTAGDDTITQLKRFAVASQLSSTGRKPRWVK